VPAWLEQDQTTPDQIASLANDRLRLNFSARPVQTPAAAPLPDGISALFESFLQGFELLLRWDIYLYISMGLVVGIVPNHMCIDDPHNGWWQDVLENGAASAYARFFDIDWNPPKEALRGKVLLPVLD
ncbi:hypothetical protein LCGC14_3124460, partial [marine sediment metagenome]